jgi:hypothetical protein
MPCTFRRRDARWSLAMTWYVNCEPTERVGNISMLVDDFGRSIPFCCLRMGWMLTCHGYVSDLILSSNLCRVHCNATSLSSLFPPYSIPRPHYRAQACVRLYRYPCLSNQSPVRIHTGHASHVLSVRFTHDDAFVLSIGADDSATMQWRVVQ